jgi:tRNA threonylcarbamoyl adenosine modification protein (Sua5/YciO/YrdC/YwlC family)
MSQFFHIHPDNPQSRLIKQACQILHQGGVIAYPTDSGYALGCHIGDKNALLRLKRIRQLDDDHNFTLLCRDLSELSSYARVNNAVFRLLKAHTPGPYTFILPATKEVPRRLQHPKKKSIGLRIPEHATALALLEELNEPLMSTTLILPGESLPMTQGEDVLDELGKQLDLVIDSGACGAEPTTVVEIIDDVPYIARLGRGDPTPFEG